MVYQFGAQRCCEQMVNIAYFYNLMGSVGNHLRLITCRFIFHAHASAHHFTACLTGVSGLVVLSMSVQVTTAFLLLSYGNCNVSLTEIIIIVFFYYCVCASYAGNAHIVFSGVINSVCAKTKKTADQKFMQLNMWRKDFLTASHRMSQSFASQS